MTGCRYQVAYPYPYPQDPYLWTCMGCQTRADPYMYSLFLLELEAFQVFFKENICSGFIGHLKPLHRALILFIKKKGSDLQLCVDYWGLNCLTKKDWYPLPLISDLLDTLQKACVFTKINLCHAYHLVHIADGDEWKTTFHTHYGSFGWLVVPFGLSNGPATFQCFMNDIFSDMLDVSVIVYLNDILIYSDDMTQPKVHIKEVL